jgi:hypothetical protein
MTKLVDTADLRVNVAPEEWEHEAPGSRFFEGIYVVSLNSAVDIAFVPDLSDSIPPWDVELPPDLDENCTSERDARLYLVRTTDYSVTPNARLAGQVGIAPRLPHSNPPPALRDSPPATEHGLVWYVSPEEWSELDTQLRDLAAHTYRQHEFVRLSEISGGPLGHFRAERFLPSGRLSAFDLQILKRD